ncbi:HNH endonuclease signature motif containing protein [Corynebacterium halotolerans]|uniref:HNH nuclease domain-containing protein n=2 Tax=Corynebacterium halotolerans TaxID=225326 RepID=M1MX51_9CORY|nr:HNH endonuclease signature motif containing protein [Corynebacterium halotolerans]AGF72339.1 hypothetical protein A605_06685 [Corynebacterium halotolerans YIM 70093 = DSM 44683]
MSTALSAPPAYYSVTNPDDPVAVLSRDVIRKDYELWSTLTHHLDPEQDSDVLAASLTRSTGMAKNFIQNNLMAILTLDELPRLRALQEELWHLDLHRLRAIDSALAPADRDHLPEVDEQLTDYLTATRPNQLVPGARAIQNKIRAILAELDDTIDTDDEPSQLPGESYAMTFNADGTADLTARFNAVDAVEIDLRVRALAEAEGLTLAQAHAALVRGADGVRVHLNAYRASDVEDAPAFIHRVGWVDKATTDTLVERACHTRDMDAAAGITTDSYTTPDVLRIHIEGRDGTCRWPGCTRPATVCQMDHRINHTDGGPTTASNLVSLCQRHHNLKTARHAFYHLDPTTGDIIWLFADGTWVYDEAEGPLSRTSRLWVQTLHQRREERHHDARSRAQHRKRMKDQANDTPEEDSPPPF